MSQYTVTILYGMAIVSTLIGGRTLLLFLESRKLPELLVAIYTLAYVPLGIVVPRLLTRLGSAETAPRGLSELSAIVGVTSITAASVAIVLFTWRVFRPDEVWARYFAFALMGVLVAGALFLVVQSLLPGERPSSGLYRLGWLTFRCLASVWAVVEPLRHYLQARRRLRHGLINPVVANRFMLFAVWTATVFSVWFVLSGYILAARITGQAGNLSILMAVLTVIFCIQMASVWLTFFPPAAYRRFLKNRAATAQAAA